MRALSPRCTRKASRTSATAAEPIRIAQELAIGIDDGSRELFSRAR
jgi:hypothetical protein